MRKFLECGDLKHSFARVGCPTCGSKMTIIGFIGRPPTEAIEKPGTQDGQRLSGTNSDPVPP